MTNDTTVKGKTPEDAVASARKILDNFERTAKALRDAIEAAPEQLRLVLRKAHDDRKSDITAFVGFCTILITNTLPGDKRTFLQNFRDVVVAHEDSWVGLKSLYPSLWPNKMDDEHGCA